MVALSALRAGNEPSLEIISDRAAHGTQILLQDELVGRGHAHHFAGNLFLLFEAHVDMWTLCAK
jgi:hypothetical protein